MAKMVEIKNSEVEIVVAALLSMACPLCPHHHHSECNTDPACRRLAERIAGGELSEIYGHGHE